MARVPPTASARALSGADRRRRSKRPCSSLICAILPACRNGWRPKPCSTVWEVFRGRRRRGALGGRRRAQIYRRRRAFRLLGGRAWTAGGMHARSPQHRPGLRATRRLWTGPSSPRSMSGPVVYGNIGSLDRLDFTVVGPTVNYVSRLETAAKLLDKKGRLLGRCRHRAPAGDDHAISAGTAQGICRAAGGVRVEGSGDSVKMRVPSIHWAGVASELKSAANRLMFMSCT